MLQQFDRLVLQLVDVHHDVQFLDDVARDMDCLDVAGDVVDSAWMWMR